jgi:anti-sigma factor RsiW
MNDELKLKLQAWLDGELSPSQAEDLARTVASDPQAQRLVAELKAVKTALAGNEPAIKVCASREFYWSQIQHRIQHQETVQPTHSFGRSLLAHWRQLLIPVAGAAAGLALLAGSLKQPLPNSTFAETTATSSEMEAVTFHDQKAGMTVVWLDVKDRQNDDDPSESEAVYEFYD